MVSRFNNCTNYSKGEMFTLILFNEQFDLLRQGTYCLTVASPHLGVVQSSVLTSARYHRPGSKTESQPSALLDQVYVGGKQSVIKTSGSRPPPWIDRVQGLVWAQHSVLASRRIQAQVGSVLDLEVDISVFNI